MEYLKNIAIDFNFSLNLFKYSINAINKIVNTSHQEGPIFNISLFETKTNAITIMQRFQTELQQLISVVEKDKKEIEKIQADELKNIQDELDRVKKHDPKSLLLTWMKPLTVLKPDALPFVMSPLQHVKIIGEITIKAIILQPILKTVSEVYGAIIGGDIYYISSWNHFAVRIGDCVFHANLGHIYTSNGEREIFTRVKECKNDKCNHLENGCINYHDPEFYLGSTDIRNFISDSMSYNLFYKTSENKSYKTRCRIGSVSNIENELLTINEGDARRFIHQTAHDIIYSIILCKQMNK